MNAIYRILFLSFISFAGLFSCTKDKTRDTCGLEHCTPGSVSYLNDIVPLIQQTCTTTSGPTAGCHGASIAEYVNVKGSIDAGTFWSVIADKSMPKTPNAFGIDTLTQAQYEMFECWICDGAPNN